MALSIRVRWCPIRHPRLTDRQFRRLAPGRAETDLAADQAYRLCISSSARSILILQLFCAPVCSTMIPHTESLMDSSCLVYDSIQRRLKKNQASVSALRFSRFVRATRAEGCGPCHSCPGEAIPSSLGACGVGEATHAVIEEHVENCLNCHDFLERFTHQWLSSRFRLPRQSLQGIGGFARPGPASSDVRSSC